MDEYPPAMNNEPTNPKPNRLHALAFLEIGLFEFGFAAVVLLLLFGTLNYFNILSISDVFPKYLSWLPRQTPPQKKLLYTPANPTPTSVQIITEQQARKDLEKIISSVVSSQNLPLEIKVTNADPKNIGAKTATFIGTWQTKDDATIQVFIGYKSGSFISDVKQIFIGIPEGMVESLDSTNSATLANRYLSFKIQAIPTCIKANSKLPKLILCEAKWSDVNGVRFDLQIMHPFEKFKQ